MPDCPTSRRSAAPLLRLAAVIALAALAACSSQRAVSPRQEAADYVRHARHNYAPPGPPGDPWGPYIAEASAKYDVPELWIREVMRQESGGQLYLDGQLITSSAGAMGLMQVMPATYDELRARYSLGNDPFDPHDNIMAGAAYLRELYDVYGSPGFLAAYNAGPGRLDDYLTRRRPLPDETRRYVARVGSAIGNTEPLRVSNAPQYAAIPINIPPGPRRGGGRFGAPVALASNRSVTAGYGRVAVQTNELPMPPAPPRAALAFAAPRKPQGFHLVSRAMADTLPIAHGGPRTGQWGIQVGAYNSPSQAHTAAEAARHKAGPLLVHARPVVGSVHQGRKTLYRARLTGLSHETAAGACQILAHKGAGCIVLSPDAQS